MDNYKVYASEQFVEEKLKNINVPEQVQADQNQNDSTAPDYIKNRTHWLEDQLVEVYPETTRGESEWNEDVFNELFEGTYVVTFDGVKYRCTAVYNAIGDSRLNSLDDLSSAIDVPFYMYCWEGPHIGGAPDGWFVSNLESGIFYADGGTHTIKIEKVEGSTYHPLDEGFIPDTIARKSDIVQTEQVQSDLNQNDESAPDYVKNRTHWTEAGKKLIVDEQTLETSGEIFHRVDLVEYLPTDHVFNLDQTYVVTINGISYTCDTWRSSNSVLRIGDSRLLDENFADEHPEDVPFILGYETEGDSFWGDLEIYFDIIFPEHGTYTIKIEQLDDTLTAYHKLDENFIPDTIARVSQITDGVYYGTKEKDFSINHVIIRNFPFPLKDGVCVIVNFPEEVLPTANGISINITPDAFHEQFKKIYDRNNNLYNKTIPANSVKMLIYDGTHWRIDDVNEEVFITVEDIDAICGATIQSASEVMF